MLGWLGNPVASRKSDVQNRARMRTCPVCPVGWSACRSRLSRSPCPTARVPLSKGNCHLRREASYQASFQTSRTGSLWPTLTQTQGPTQPSGGGVQWDAKKGSRKILTIFSNFPPNPNRPGGVNKLKKEAGLVKAGSRKERSWEKKQETMWHLLRNMCPLQG